MKKAIDSVKSTNVFSFILLLRENNSHSKCTDYVKHECYLTGE